MFDVKGLIKDNLVVVVVGGVGDIVKGCPVIVNVP